MEPSKISNDRFGLTKEALDKIINVLKSFPEVKKALVFGSRALGTYKRGSDIDIALYGKDLEQVIVKISYQLNEEIALPYFFDIVDYYSLTKQELKEHIDRIGITFYSK